MAIETKRKDSPEGLAGDKYFNLIEHAADGIAIIQGGVFKLVNTALTHISGYDKEELLGMPFTKLLTPASQKLTLARYQARLSGKKVPQVYEIQAVTKDGQIRDIEINAALTEYDGRAADEVIIRDITERKQAEAAIHKTQQEKTAILDSMSELVIFQDLEHRIIWTNTTAAESAGMTHEQLVGKHCYEIWPQRNKPCVGCPVTKARRTGKPQGTEMTTPDGRVWFVRGYPMRDANGSITGMLEVTLDITEHKQAEQALADEATRRHILVDQSLDGIVVLDQDGKVYEANQRFAEMLGYTPEEVRQLNVFDWEYLYPREQVVEMLRTVNEAGDHFETQHRRKDGSTYDVEISTNGALVAGQKLIFCVCRDITERKKAEEKLRESEEEKSALLEEAPISIFSIDLKGKITYANKRFESESGYSREEIIGKNAFKLDWFSEGTLRYFIQRMAARLRGKPHKNWATQFKCKDGRWIWIETEGKVLRKSGAVVGFQIVARDITERKQAEEALQAERNKLQSLINAMEDDLSIQDKDFNIIYQNEPSRISTGGDHTGEKCYRAYEGRDKICDGCPVEKAYKDGKSHTSDRRVVLPSREAVFWENTANPIRDSRGNIISCLEIGRNVTKRKQAEQALADEATRRRILIDQSRDGIVILDQDGKVYEANQRFAEMLGYTPEEVRELHMWDWDTQWPREQLLEMVRSVDASGDHFETHNRRKDGSIIDVEISTNGAVVAGQKLVFCVCRDITERKKREQLQHSENYVLTLLGQGANLSELLDAIVHLGEQDDPSIKGSVLLFDPTKGLLFQASAPSLPDDYQELFKNGIPVGPESGSCGTAAYRKERVSVPDIANSPLFKPAEEVIKRAVNNSLLAVWSQPIIASNGDLLGTIANYSNKAGEPSADNLRVLEWSARIAALAIERKKAEDALRESEERYRAVIEGAHDMILSVALDGSINFVNQAWLDALGYAKADLPNLNLFEVIHPDSLPHCRELFARVTKGEPVHNIQISLLTKDGRKILAEGNAAPRYIGDKVVATQSIFRNITDRKNMEKQLQEKNEELDAQNEELRAINEELRATEEELQHSQERLERMFESVTDGIVVAATNGTILKVNQSAVQMHGFTTDDELLGKNALELSAPRDHEKITQNMRRALKEGTLSGVECNLLKADGSEFPAELSTSALKNASGKVIGHITTVRDITERKQAEEREDQLEQELNLASRLASIGQLAAGVAHEINNPLTGVIGFSHLMLSRDIPDDMKQDLQVIHSEAQRVAKIVENLLIFAHQRKAGREYVNINDIITRVLELRAYEMKVNNIDVENQLDSELPFTMADAGQLQQVFLNIILNAEYFMTKAHNKGKLLVKTEKINGNIRVSFTDNGTGISPENLDKIFNPFFTTKEVGKGTGLGLSICHGIITQHKGRIYAQSQPGKGATFVIELPIVAEPVQTGKAKVTQKEPQKPRKAKILVVDDEAAILTFLGRLLTEWGHNVETINNADTALEKLRTERYSLVLLDIKLPGMSGIELYHHIEEIAPALARRVMFVTGDVMQSATRSFLEKTGAPYITKPLDIETLKKTINRALNQTQVTVKASG